MSDTFGSADYTDIPLPLNARIGAGTRIVGDAVTAKSMFRRFRSIREIGLLIGEHSFLDGVAFNVGEQGRIDIGNHCEAIESFLIAESEIRIGNRVFIGWHATLADSDFHPVDPAARIRDGLALAPGVTGLPREPYTSRTIIVEDDVWIGPSAVILKGVLIGRGAIIEPGSVVVHDVPAGARVLGNPARIIEASSEPTRSA